MFRPEHIGAVKLEPRTNAVLVPELPAAWFDGDGPQSITVRQLTGNELAMVQAADESRNLRASLAKALQAGTAEEMQSAAIDALGRNPEVITPVYARKLESVRLGTVPPIAEEIVAAIGENYPMVLERLYGAISALTGKGADIEKKPERSTPTEASKPA